MKHNLLFPSVFKIIGLILAVTGLVLGYLFTWHDYVIPFFTYGPRQPNNSILAWTGRNNLTDEFTISFFVIGTIFIGFSKLKNESERTNKLRRDALYWSVLTNILIVLIDLIAEYVGEKLQIPRMKHYDFLTYDVFILLIIFIARFYYLLFQSKRDNQSKQIYMFPFKPYNVIWKITVIVLLIVVLASIKFPQIDSLLKKVPNEIIVLFPMCLLIWIWSKEKKETDTVKDIRMSAMVLAMFINYTLFLMATWFIYGFDYLEVQVFSVLSLPIIFLIVFYYKLYFLHRESVKKPIHNY